MKKEHAFYILWACLLIIFLYILYNEPSAASVTRLFSCALENNVCGPGQLETVTNVFIMITALIGFRIAMKEGWI